MESIAVGLAERSYDILIGTKTLELLGERCRALDLGTSAAVITNSVVGPLYLKQVKDSLASAGFTVHALELPDGEEYKNACTLNSIYDFLVRERLDRGSFIVALGGGVVGDMAGYAAATFLRGVPFVQVPTTLLAQVDSSVGGKTGINHPLGKNLIGAFYQPRLVAVDLETLDTLPEREFIGGAAEVIKYGVVLDKEFFDYLAEKTVSILERDKESLRYIVKRCCTIKSEVVESDERESGLRAVLNYGHTLGHAVEAITGYKEYIHGEAVAIGMAQAAKLSELRGLSTAADTERIRAILRGFGLPLDLPPFPASYYLDTLMRDKKVKGGGLSFVFNRGIGGFSIEKVTEMGHLLKECGIRD